MRAADIIADCRELQNDPHGDVHTDEAMLGHLNRVLRDITTRSRCLVDELYLPAVSGQSRYGLPADFLRLEYAGWQRPGGRYHALSKVRFDIASWASFNARTGTPCYYDIFGHAAVERVVSVVEESSVEAQWVRLKGESLQGIKRGDRIVNVSDGSSVGAILEVRQLLDDSNVASQILVYSDMADGTRTVLQVGDEVRILSPGAPRQSLIVSPVPTAVGDIGDEALVLFIARIHRKITRGDLAEENDTLEVDPEFEPCLREYIIHYMMRLDATKTEADAYNQLVMANTLYAQAVPEVGDRVRQWRSRFSSGVLSVPRQGPVTRRVNSWYPVGAGYESK